MKKLAYLATAVLAGLGFTSTASADVSISGSQTLVYSASGSVTGLRNYGSVDFGLSTTTASGMTISSGAGISLTDGATGNTSTADAKVYGWDGLTFASGGVTVEIGTDVNLADGVGEVDGVHASAATADHSGMKTVTNTVGVTTDEGAGVSLTTSMGSATLSLAYVADSAVDGGASERLDDATGTGMSAKISTSVGAVGVTAAYVSFNDTSIDDTETAVALSYSSDMGDFTVGYGDSSGANDGSVVSGAYTMALDADTSISIGYASYDVDSTSGTETNVSLTRALGGGASLFADFGSVSGTTTNASAFGSSALTDESVFAIGTSVSF